MVRDTNSITKRERDCLVSIKERSETDFPMRLHEVASIMRIKPPTALNVVNRLKGKGLLESKGGMIVLTETGDSLTKSILMVHRTFESLFCQSGVSKGMACNEAGEIDFLIPEENASLVLKRIDSPSRCPHGKPILE